MFKKIALAFVGLIVIVLIGSYFVFTHLDGYIKQAIEKYGSEATKTAVELSTVKLSLASGSGGGELDNFTVGNPDGFSSNKAVSVGVVSMTVDTDSVRGNGPIIIKEIVIKQPQINYELNNDGSSNLQTIQHNTQSYASAAGGGNSGGSDNAPSQPSRKVIIDNLIVQGGQLSISQASLKDQKLSSSLPDLRLTDIGKNSGGATAAQVAQQVIGSITGEAVRVAVAELAKEKISGALKDVPASAIGGAAVDHVGTEIKGIFGQ